MWNAKIMGSATTQIALAALALALAVASVTADRDNETKVAKAENVMLLYIGAENCGPCTTWQRGDGTAFRGSKEFARVTYREVKSPTLFDVLKDQNWPDDLIAYRQSIDRRAGVPLWLVVVDGQVVMQSFGQSQWQEAVLPKLKALLR